MLSAMNTSALRVKFSPLRVRKVPDRSSCERNPAGGGLNEPEIALSVRTRKWPAGSPEGISRLYPVNCPRGEWSVLRI